MTDLHPHWQSTPDDGPPAPRAPVPAPGPTSAPVRVQVQAASRMPAAVAGIALFAVIGFSAAGGWDALSENGPMASLESFTAQVGGAGSSSQQPAAAVLPELAIHIAAAGFEPARAVVRPGQRIVWINDQSIPHILTSQTLRDGSGAYLNTPAIFPGAKTTFTVGPDETSRDHTITSTTDQSLLGTVTVQTGNGPLPVTSSSSSAKALFGGTDGVNLPSGNGSATGGTSSRSSSSRSAFSASSRSSSSRQSSSAVVIDAPDWGTADGPGMENDGSLDPFGNPQAPGIGDEYAPANPEPLEQPHTGPGLWLVAGISVAVLWGMTRKYFVMVK